ncbi:uncharacterized protein LTR77_003898 [Saxophila tyrrhenica]|uniref:Amidase domain-containing protein n=1 Tax=Saxophila tyrrhenica TaxID=1690608 RepID=A0AAV9PEY3_9PEZI|nr:hypothetical protein LTR77_003898 [Saxophila tyrrhenica]
MSVVTLGHKAPNLDPSTLETLTSKAGIRVREDHAGDFLKVLGALDESCQDVLDEEDYTPELDLSKYPRTDVHRPEDTDKGGWAMRCNAYATSPTNDLLKAKMVALKDNIALAGMKCTNGTEALDWTPAYDATIATRIMDAGATITGKAACESACFEGVSDTSCTGKVHNPYADNYSCGGSSSGSGRLVATGSVDMAIGCDQGGSIRIPSAMCGIVGLKPTWGLVPYTSIISLEATIDHAGPMARSVPDVARLLQAIAGSDGIDDRQPHFLPDGTLDYMAKLDGFLKSSDSSKPLSGTKIGLLEEGFTIPGMDPNISNLCHSAVDKLKDLGAEVTSVSIPGHLKAAILWMVSVPIAGTRQGFFTDMTGRKQLHMLDRQRASGESMTQDAFDKLGPGAQNAYIRYLYMMDKYGPIIHSKCSNLLRKVNDEYDQALASVDVLVMPTLPSPPCRLFDDPPAHGPLARLSRNVGLVGNTSPFNSITFFQIVSWLLDADVRTGTGHPAITFPVGFVPAHDDESIRLPTGLQVVGKKFADSECMKVAAAFERAYDWKTL